MKKGVGVGEDRDEKEKRKREKKLRKEGKQTGFAVYGNESGSMSTEELLRLDEVRKKANIYSTYMTFLLVSFTSAYLYYSLK
jgi:hypothetical protein